MKILLLLIYLFLSISLFSQENIELNIGPEYYYSSNINVKDYSSDFVSIIIGFTGIHYFSEIFGLYINLNLDLPIINITNYNNTSYVSNWSDNIFWIGIDGLIGPIFCLIKNENLRIPVSFGFHIIRMTTIYNGIGSITKNYGVGINFGIEKNLDKNLYISMKLSGFFDMLSNNERQNIYEFFTDRVHFDNRNWGIAPIIAIGLRK